MIITLLVGLVVFALLYYLFNNALPIVDPFRTAINVVLIIACILWLLSLLGVLRFPLAH